MARNLTAAVAALSLLLAAATLTAWPLTVRGDRGLQLRRGRNWVVVLSGRAGVQVQAAHVPVPLPAVWSIGRFAGPSRLSGRLSPRPSDPRLRWDVHLLGCRSWATRGGSLADGNLIHWTPAVVTVAAPHPVVVAIFLVLPVLYGWGWRRRRTVRRRLATGQCVRCGYDLRGSPGRCPECGAVAVARVPHGDPMRG